MINKINIRVYAIYINENLEIMALDEGYAGQKLIKLPGGGLEFGEGTLECLHREFAEELNLKINVVEHFYLPDDEEDICLHCENKELIIKHINKVLEANVVSETDADVMLKLAHLAKILDGVM